MGCGGSKVDSLPLVTLCRERKQYIKTAGELQHAMALAHTLYFRALKEVGEILNGFVDEELMVASSSPYSSPSPMDSPILMIPSDDWKQKARTPLSATPVSHSPSDSHLIISSDSEHNSSSHIHFVESPPMEEPPSPSYPPTGGWGYTSSSSNAFYMKKLSPAIPSVFYEEPQSSTAQWGHFGSSSQSFSRDSPPEPDPPPPPSPRVSVWDFMNPFDNDHNAYEYHPASGRGYGCTSGSPDSQEVREREGIPELEEEAEQEVLKEVQREGTTTVSNVEGYEPPKPVHFQNIRGTEKLDMDSLKKPEVEVEEVEVGRSQKDATSVIGEENEVVGKRMSVGIEGTSAAMDVEEPTTGCSTSLAAHGSRNFIEAVREIRREFDAASNCGKEVADILDVGTLPYRPKNTAVNVIFSRILYFFSSANQSPDDLSAHLASNIIKGKRSQVQDHGNLSLTLEKLYFWERKLFKQIKDEERVRVRYERRRKKLRGLSERGVDSSRMDAQQASMKKLLTKLEVFVRSIDAIAHRIHKLRDEELHPQVHNLVKRSTVMWRAMLRCHRAQLEAIRSAEASGVRMNTTGLSPGGSSTTTQRLESEILAWCARLGDWVRAQRSYAEAMNEWLTRWLLHDDVADVSPGRAGAPPVFSVCDDWARAMGSVSAQRVDSALREFARGLRRLSERQEDVRLLRAGAESLSTRVGSGREIWVARSEELRSKRVALREAARVVRAAAPGSVRNGLLRVFESLFGFTAQAVDALEQVRVPE